MASEYMKLQSRVGTPSNLATDETYDILVFNPVSGFPNGRVRLSFGSTPRKITGVQKVAQTFAKILMTGRGSDPFIPELGTDFLEYFMTSSAGSEPSKAAIRMQDAIREAESQTQSLLAGRNDPASQLRSATLIDSQINEEGVTMYIRIITESGDTAAVAIPFPQTDLLLNA